MATSSPRPATVWRPPHPVRRGAEQQHGAAAPRVAHRTPQRGRQEGEQNPGGVVGRGPSGGGGVGTVVLLLQRHLRGRGEVVRQPVHCEARAESAQLGGQTPRRAGGQRADRRVLLHRVARGSAALRRRARG
eukprot:gene1000-biopygen15250